MCVCMCVRVRACVSVLVCRCVCVCARARVRACACVCARACACACVRACVRACVEQVCVFIRACARGVYLSMHACACACVCVRTRARACVRVHVCVCVCVRGTREGEREQGREEEGGAHQPRQKLTRPPAQARTRTHSVTHTARHPSHPVSNASHFRSCPHKSVRPHYIAPSLRPRRNTPPRLDRAREQMRIQACRRLALPLPFALRPARRTSVSQTSHTALPAAPGPPGPGPSATPKAAMAGAARWAVQRRSPVAVSTACTAPPAVVTSRPPARRGRCWVSAHWPAGGAWTEKEATDAFHDRAPVTGSTARTCTAQQRAHR